MLCVVQACCAGFLTSCICLPQPPKRYWEEVENEDKKDPDEDKTPEGEAPKELSDKKHNERRKERNRKTDGKFISGVCMFNITFWSLKGDRL